MDNLQPYFKIAETEAMNSPCVRRKYGAVIVYPGTEIKHISAHNSRIGRCCNSHCVRERLNIQHNGSVEVGAEIHSEAAVLINRGKSKGKSLFILAGFDGRTNKPLWGANVYPCHTCAVLLKYAGYDFIFTRNEDGEIAPLSVSGIIDFREEAWSENG